MARALIAMSGGVDSSVAAYLMGKEGYDCIGCTMKLFENADVSIARGRACCSLDDVEDARNVAFALAIPYYVFRFSEEFVEKVIDKFVRSYERGFTPNPCIDCNRYLKFGKLFERAEAIGCDCIATGHYARITFDAGRFHLKKALDETKDQSYVLYAMDQSQLARTRFPLGELRKSRVRAIAEANGFLNADKADSQDICFVPDGDYAAFLEKRTGKRYPAGDFIGTDGQVLGRHQGIIRYTIGQRRGLGLSFPRPMYVKRIDPAKATVTLCPDEDLFESTAEVEDANWISGMIPRAPFPCKAKIRYRQREQPAVVEPIGESAFRIRCETPQRAITPGQAAVLYDGDEVLGGGMIRMAGPHPG